MGVHTSSATIAYHSMLRGAQRVELSVKLIEVGTTVYQVSSLYTSPRLQPLTYCRSLLGSPTTAVESRTCYAPSSDVILNDKWLQEAGSRVRSTALWMKVI